MNADRIGFLDVPMSFTFDGGSLTICPDFDAAKAGLTRMSIRMDFIYPPIVRNVRIYPSSGKKTWLPKTQTACVAAQNATFARSGAKGSERHSEVSFGIVRFCDPLFGFLFGTRLQYCDWWLEGRIPIKSTSNVYVDRKTAESFVSKAIATWKNFDRRNKRVVSNVLYLYAKSGSLEWDWERFQMEYTVFDACHALLMRGRSVGFLHIEGDSKQCVNLKD